MFALPNISEGLQLRLQHVDVLVQAYQLDLLLFYPFLKDLSLLLEFGKIAAPLNYL